MITVMLTKPSKAGQPIRPEDLARLRKIVEGGPGSGEKPGHPFRGNQYTQGDFSVSGMPGVHASPPVEMQFGFFMGDGQKIKDQCKSLLDKLPKNDADGVTKIALVDPSSIDEYCGVPNGTLAFKAGGIYREDEKDIIINITGDEINAANLYHEVGHAAYFNSMKSQHSAWWQFAADVMKGKIKAPSAYARKSPAELFAECYSRYHVSKATRAKLAAPFRKWFDEYYAKKESLIEGGDGSGEKTGHPFRGNQYTKGQAEIDALTDIPRDAKDFGNIDLVKPDKKKEAIGVAMNWGVRLNTVDTVRILDGLSESWPEGWHTLQEYVSSGHRGINHFLRHGDKPIGFRNVTDEELEEQIDIMDSITDNEFQEDVVLYRSMNSDIKNFDQGDEFEDKGFGSCSLDRGTAMSFGHDITARIYAPKGTKGTYVAYHAVPDELEAILARNTQYRVLKVMSKKLIDGRTVWELDLVVLPRSKKGKK